MTDTTVETSATTSSTDVVDYNMPWSGEVIAVDFTLSAAASAGSMTLGATFGGTEDADTTLTVTTAANGTNSGYQ